MKPYSAGTTVLEVVIKALRTLSVRWLKDNITTAMFIDSLEIKVEALHTKAAQQAHKKLKKHLGKAREISERRDRIHRKAFLEAVHYWNDDKI